MNLSFFIAKRYLFAKKSHNVINIISIISAVGVAIGTMALIIILSVYNGFNEIVKGLYGSYEADLVIEPVYGKFFSPLTSGFDLIKANKSIVSYSEVVEENVFLRYDRREGVGTIRGVDTTYENATGLIPYLIEGDFELYWGDVPQAVVGVGLARSLGIRPRFLDPLDIYFPSKNREVSVLDPMSAVNKVNTFPIGLLAVEQGFDNKYLFIPISVARELLELKDEVSFIEINLVKGVDIEAIQKEFSSILGEGFKVKNRFQQNETVYKMMIFEKIAIYTILFFIILIISCNIFGSLSMLIIEKQRDIEILNNMGADVKFIKKIFVTEGWLISLTGILSGMCIGLVLAYIQQKYGIIRMAGNFIVKSYPVIIKPMDVLIVFAGVSLLSFFIISQVRSAGFDKIITK